MSIPSTPKGYDLEYLVFQLSGGDMKQADYIWNHATFEECFFQVCMKQYEAFVNEKMMNG